MKHADIVRIVEASDPKNILFSPAGNRVGTVLLQNRPFIEEMRIVELGSASTRLLPHLFQMRILSYVGVDPFFAYETRGQIEAFLLASPEHTGKLSAVAEDGLTYLARQRRALTVISTGVLDSSVIGSNIRADPVVDQYRMELARHIYRVTPPGGLSYHVGIDTKWSGALTGAGFTSDNKDSFLFLKEV
jgi:hypothetical protein